MLEEKDLQAIAQLILASEERLRAEFHAKLEMEIRASEERMREGMSAEFHAGENRTHAYIENGVMKPIRLLAEGHAQILERLPGVDALAGMQFRANGHGTGTRNRRTQACINDSRPVVCRKRNQGISLFMAGCSFGMVGLL